MQQAELIRVGLASRLPRTPRTSVANVSASSSNDLSLRDGGCVAVMPMFIWTSTIMRIIEDYPSGKHTKKYFTSCDPHHDIYTFCYWQIFWHIFWHSICHISWHFIWHIFWHSIWHSIWHILWHFIWHIFWHSI